MDSTILLHELSKQKASFTAVYIHHGLQLVADEWVIHCKQQASNRAVSFRSVRVQVPESTRRGLEDRAREARYGALWQQVEESGVLLTAHHQRDQAETFLLRALRGAGVAGLGAIKLWQERDLDRALVRPLLSISFVDMQNYAQREGLHWIEDPTNCDDFALRNRIRKKLIPLLSELQPQSEQQLAMSAQHAQEAQALLQILGREDWQKCQLSNFRWDVCAWRALPWSRAKNALMTLWYDRLGVSLSVAQWQQIEYQFYVVRLDSSHPRFCWRGWCLLIDGGEGYFLSESSLTQPDSIVGWFAQDSSNQVWGDWAKLMYQSSTAQAVTIKPREGGESIKTVYGTKTLKKWLQQQAVPAWQKRYWPVVYDAQTLVLLGWANMPLNWSQSGVAISLQCFPAADHQAQ
jgi:tRNA(Ile)-lysidine synthase